jgi:hypothetical protein
MRNPSRSGSCASVEAATIVTDARYVTSVESHTHTHENRMATGGGRVCKWSMHALMFSSYRGVSRSRQSDASV